MIPEKGRRPAVPLDFPPSDPVNLQGRNTGTKDFFDRRQSLEQDIPRFPDMVDIIGVFQLNHLKWRNHSSLFFSVPTVRRVLANVLRSSSASLPNESRIIFLMSSFLSDVITTSPSATTPSSTLSFGVMILPSTIPEAQSVTSSLAVI